VGAALTRCTWARVLVGLIAIGLIGAGLFTADLLSGYPPGTPAVPVGAAVTSDPASVSASITTKPGPQTASSPNPSHRGPATTFRSPTVSPVTINCARLVLGSRVS